MTTTFSWQLLETGERGYLQCPFTGFIRVKVRAYTADTVTVEYTGKTAVYTHGETITCHRSYFFADRLYVLRSSRQHPGRKYAALRAPVQQGGENA